jgi:hypothetical protein
LVDSFPKRVVGNVEFASDFGPGVAFLKELQSLLDDWRGHDRRPASSTRSVKALDAFLAILLDTPQNAALGDAKGPNNVRLLASPLDAELRGEHAKGSQIPFTVLKHRLRAAEIEPVSVLTNNADQIADAASILRN